MTATIVYIALVSAFVIISMLSGLLYFCSRNTQFSFTQLYNNSTTDTTTSTTTPITTISRQTFDAEHQWPNQQSRSRSHSSTTTIMSHNNHRHHQQQQQVYSDPPPPYDEIVVGIHLANTSPNTAIVY